MKAWRQILPNDEIPSTLTLLDNEKCLLLILYCIFDLILN